MNAADLESAVRELWLGVVLARDAAFKLRNEFRESDPEYSVLWLIAEDLQQAARRARRLVDKTVR